MGRNDCMRYLLQTMALICMAVAWLGTATALANSAPDVIVVSAGQRDDGSKRVDIYYNLADADGDPCTVSVLVSADGGVTRSVAVASCIQPTAA